MKASSPSERYFEACAGAWRAPFDLRITDPVALQGSGMGWFDRAALRTIARWPMWLGRPVLHTTVAPQAAESVIHTTTLRWRRLVFFRSIETLRLDADGRSFTLEGRLRVGPLPTAARPFTGRGEVDADAITARYALNFLGGPVEQNLREPALVTLTQRGSGWEGVQRLRRV